MRVPHIGESEEPQSMSAMSDVVFLLLIFFIITMSGYVEMTFLEANLPTSGSVAAVEVDLQNSLNHRESSENKKSSGSRSYKHPK